MKTSLTMFVGEKAVIIVRIIIAVLCPDECSMFT